MFDLSNLKVLKIQETFMLYKHLMITAAFAGLAACSSSSGDGGSGVLSSGVLNNVEIPSDADLSGLPANVQTLVSDFVTLNESNTPTTTMPTGSATYAGKWGMGADESDVVIVGDLNMVAAFDSHTITGNVSNLVGDDNGKALVIGNSLDVVTNISGNKIQGTANGTLTLEGENYVVNSSMDGAFGGNAAQAALGTTTGQVKNPDGSTDNYSGYFAAEKQ